MRIIAGKHRGRLLKAPEGRHTRPTSARAREALFNILAHAYGGFVGKKVGDIFAGSGALGFEALSRGAEAGVFVDMSPAAIEVVRRNALMLKEEVTLLKADATRIPAPPFLCDILFLDPPYGKGLVNPCLLALKRGDWLFKDQLLVIETNAEEELTPPPFLELQDKREQGIAKLEIFRVNFPVSS